MKKFNGLTVENTTSKSFRYSKGECSLSFTLRVDIKKELEDFEELLVCALADVRAGIAAK